MESKNIKCPEYKENIVLKPKENQYILEILSYLAYLHVNAKHKYTKIIKIIRKTTQIPNSKSGQEESN